MSLHRSHPSQPGIRRIRRGRGFAYIDPDGRSIDDPAVRERIDALAIPPAWTDVWISADPRGHLQAAGLDAAGRRQYRYHDAWRRRRDRAKFRRLEDFGARLPGLRATVGEAIRERGFPRERVLAGTVRCLDTGGLRIGNEDYRRQHGSFGLTTLRSEHVRLSDGVVRFRFPGKSGVQQDIEVPDLDVARLLRGLRRAHDGQLWAWRNGGGWHDVRSLDVNAFVHELADGRFSAKDFRTWHATVRAAELLAEHDPGEGKRAVRAVLRGVADSLGNTPAVARSSYIDPRVLDRFLDEGQTIADVPGDDVDARVLTLLHEAGDPA